MATCTFKRKNGTLLMFAFLVLIIITFAYVKISNKIQQQRLEEIKCLFNDLGNALSELKESEPRLGQSIFFHETYCLENMNDIKLSFRQACSVESAVIVHPKNGYVLQKKFLPVNLKIFNLIYHSSF